MTHWNGLVTHAADQHAYSPGLVVITDVSTLLTTLADNGRCSVVQYQVGDGPWRHGRTIPAWLRDDPDGTREQRRYTVQNVHDNEHVPPGARVRTRVLPEADGWAALDQQRQETQ